MDSRFKLATNEMEKVMKEFTEFKITSKDTITKLNEKHTSQQNISTTTINALQDELDVVKKENTTNQKILTAKKRTS